MTELLDGQRWAGCGPLRLSLLGLVPRSLHPGAERSAEVEAALPALVTALAEEARRLGYALDRRQADGTHGVMTRRAATASDLRAAYSTSSSAPASPSPAAG